MSSIPGIEIAIIGAGPAGLALARILVRETPPPGAKTPMPASITLFDRDPSPSDPVRRPQGGSLDLHEDSGQLGVREAGVWQAFLTKAHYEAQGWRVDDKYGQVAVQVTEEAGMDRNKPEIG